MRILLLICRLIVGSLFIVSGLIKANDPLGFSYKLEEYFAESALNLPFLEPYSLGLAVLACVAEIVLGFAVLFGGRMKLASVSLVILTVFFGWLTMYTAQCDPQGTYTVMVNGVEETRGVTCVTDCGCFGDAMKGSVGRSLTPWESFTKDAILFVFIVPITIAAFSRKGIQWNTVQDDRVLLTGGLLLIALWSWIFTWGGPVWFAVIGYLGYFAIKGWMQGTKAEWAAAIWIAVLSLVFTWYAYAHLPFRDYRPYAEGNSIKEQKAMGKPPVNQTFVSYRNKTTGEVTEYDSSKPYPWDDPNMENVPNSTRVVEIEAGIASPVQDFVLTNRDGYEATDDIVNEAGPVLLVMMYNVKKTPTDLIPAIAKLTADASAQGWYVYGVSASPWEDIEEVRHANQLAFEFLQADEKVIKTTIRANPGIMLLQDGTVRGLWHGNDTPVFEEAKAELK
jgi:uncharacterized membrane protein YphA (DoxX/SURF4 family)